MEVRYHPGTGGVDEILRPTLLSVDEGSCYRLVKNSWPWEAEGEEFAANEGMYLVPVKLKGSRGGHYHTYIKALICRI